jgi:flavin-dependent dehydrogenase
LLRARSSALVAKTARRQADVLVVGGGPAGLSAAIAAGQRGLDVIVADYARPPIDKACGEGLMPNGVAALNQLGVTLPRGETVPFHGIRFFAHGSSAEARFHAVAGLGIRRQTLHRLLIARAGAVGVRFLWGPRARALASEGVVFDTGIVASRWIVGADGERSQMRGWAGLDRGGSCLRRFGFRRHARVAPWTDVVEVYWGRGAQVFVTPVGLSEVCIAMLSRSPHLRFDHLPLVCPEVAQRVAGTPLTTSERGSISASRRLRAVTRERVALIGEASGSVDAVTGEGLSIIFQDALALGDALAQGDLTRYEVVHRRIGRLPAAMARLLLGMDRSPWLCRRGMRALAAEPLLFSRLLALHAETPRSPAAAVRCFCALGWRLVTA